MEYVSNEQCLNSEGNTVSVRLQNYIHQLYQTSSFQVTSVMSHINLKKTEVNFKQTFTCFNPLTSNTKNTLKPQFFVLFFKNFPESGLQTPIPPPPFTEGALAQDY